MSSYGGRRAPNFAQYLEDLNTIPSPYDQSVQQQEAEPFNIDAELALFTNTEFLDFGHFGDMNMPLGFSPAEEEQHKAHEEKHAAVEKHTEMNYMDLLNDLGNMPDYTSNFTSEESHNLQHMNSTFHSIPTVQNTPHPVEETTGPVQQQPPRVPKTEIPSPTNISSFVSTPMQIAGTKRKQSHDSKTLDEAARAAAEEDKRRRNTAASARFRVKKKQREQALEKSVKEASEKNAVLEARVSQLELENQWLKNLITEKNGSESGEGKQRSETDIAHMFKNFLASHKAGKEQSSESKIGVGTA
ncbi:bZIP transcription factor (MetR), putative [Talaromyces stipitatus ATCC 10500]|uniref:BZIP transcription factor (MetR), putative n=1 Tax=Talaromyces stipitatus (strain ATCC 10500 / CBS 375.48 / QM 6759 / NRRL 1006) TaxID=441959 RepID=B8LUC3_TALSN|nr:bZIP transcription factor (MetR), putative [Talaromyces stipitatus ATCC 10500]EED23696.1 bZIP transcription factor (MetR), putative [Talaromyces stipitatus ATCC 10500]